MRPTKRSLLLTSRGRVLVTATGFAAQGSKRYHTMSSVPSRLPCEERGICDESTWARGTREVRDE